jgi:hypothetical protein
MQALIAESTAALPKMLQQPAGRRTSARWDWRRSAEHEREGDLALH